jgi:serine protease AprX
MLSRFGLLLLLSSALFARNPKVDPELAGYTAGQRVRVIVKYAASAKLPTMETLSQRGTVVHHHQLDIINAHAISVDAGELEDLANSPDVESVTLDHPISATLDNAAAAVNASAAWNAGISGSGIGIAVIDSGISAHPDLYGRVVYNEDFTGQGQNADQFGHGTHVAVVLAGSGSRSSGSGYTKTFRGMAYSAKLLNLRALDSAGVGTDSTVIAAIQRAVKLKSQYNIRVINLSLGRPVIQSYTKDPLCQAVESAWKAGIVVVVAAGNYGRDNNNGIQGYGTITAPGNDPYVITVGAMKTMGTPGRGDDLLATYSSKGPTLYDHIVKPDIVAPGNLIHSGLTPDKVSTGLFMTYPTTQFSCTYYMTSCGTGMSQDYYLLSGTSMAAPMVSGAAADMIAANASLTPDQVKARLMKTAYKAFPASSTAVVGNVTYTSYYDAFSAGAGYLDIQAALANTDTATGNSLSPSVSYNSTTDSGALVLPSGSAFGTSTFASGLVWGTGQLINGSGVVWGTSTTWANGLVWGTAGTAAFGVVWGTGNNGTVDPAGVVWGTNIVAGQLAPLVSILTRGE